MNKISLFGTVLLTILTASCTTTPSEPTSQLPGERILSFHSEAIVREDGWIDVTETISVRAEGLKIRRGIYRDLPNQLQFPNGYSMRPVYVPQSVSRNGAMEDFKTAQSRNSIRTYFGHPERMLAPGVHTYIFHYRINRMLSLFPDREELSWYVTGNYWDFPIDSVTAIVVLDLGGQVKIQGSDAFVSTQHGYRYQGRQCKECVTTQKEHGSVEFQLKTTLVPREGLTVVVAWPKGHVFRPVSE